MQTEEQPVPEACWLWLQDAVHQFAESARMHAAACEEHLRQLRELTARVAASTAVAVHPPYSNGLPQDGHSCSHRDMFGTPTGMAWTTGGTLLMACPNYPCVYVFKRSAPAVLYERINSVYGLEDSAQMGPWGIAAHNGRVYVCCHSSNRILVMDGSRVRTLKEGFCGVKTLSKLKAIAVGTRDGRTYAVVHDSGNRRVFYFACDDKEPSGWLVLMRDMSVDAEVGIAFDNVGLVAVSNSDTGEVQMIGLIPDPVGFVRPSYPSRVELGSGIRASAIAFDPSDNLVVLDCTNRSVTIFNCVTGATLRQVSIVGWTPCRTVTVDSAGNVLVPCREECGAVRRIAFQ